MNESKPDMNDELSSGAEVETPAPRDSTCWGRLNWLTLAAGACLLLAGFVLLNMADAWAENAAAAFSPFCILGGFALLFISLIVRPTK